MNKKFKMILSGVLALSISFFISPICASAAERTETITPEKISVYYLAPTSVDASGNATGLSPYYSAIDYDYGSLSTGYKASSVKGVKAYGSSIQTRIAFYFSDEDLLKLQSASSASVTVNTDTMHRYATSWIYDSGSSVTALYGYYCGAFSVQNGSSFTNDIVSTSIASSSTRCRINDIGPMTMEGDFSDTQGIVFITYASLPSDLTEGCYVIADTGYVEVTVELSYDTDVLISNQIEQVITSNESDKSASNDFQNNVSDKSSQSGQLAEDSQVDKPEISDEDLNPMEQVDSEDLQTMGAVIGSVFVSPTLSSIAIMTLVFALIGYILYGKR